MCHFTHKQVTVVPLLFDSCVRQGEKQWLLQNGPLPYFLWTLHCIKVLQLAKPEASVKKHLTAFCDLLFLKPPILPTVEKWNLNHFTIKAQFCL